MMIETIDLLNIKAQKLLGDKISHYIQPVEFISTNQTSVTICPKDTDTAFTLNPPVAGYVKNTPKGKKDIDNAAVWTGIVGYAAAVRMAEDDQYFTFVVINVLNQALKELALELGDLTFREITACRPGSNNKYFRDIESCAGYELRLYVKEKK